MSRVEYADDPIPLLVSSGTPTPSVHVPPCTSKDRPRDGSSPETSECRIFGEVELPARHCRTGAGAVVNGHMSHMHFQDFVVMGPGTVVRPPLRTALNSTIAQCPATVSIGAFTVMGAGTVCEAAAVGRYVRMDNECVVGCGAKVADGVWLRERTWVPPEAVLAPFTVYEGCPAAARGRLNPEAAKLLQMEYVRALLKENASV